MANLKLIKVTGSPFCDNFYGCIGIQTKDSQFQIIKNGILNSQSSYSGCGWEYATAEEIEENWKLIYPHWTPEVGDNVIITQDFQQWTNSRGTIIEKDGSSDYYRVESVTGRSCIFDYTRQMILAPYSKSIVEPTEKPKLQSKYGFTLGDKVISTETSGPRAYKQGTVVHFEDSQIGVAYEDYSSGHGCNGNCPDGKGWYSSPQFIKHYTEPEGEPEEPEETATTKFKIGDRVKCIGITIKGYGKLGTVRKIGGSVGVEFDENVDGHTLDGCCKDGHGWWIGSPSLELVTESKPKEEFVNVRFLTEQQFKDQSLWTRDHPKGWNSDGHMNGYLGQSAVIPKSSIRSNGSFRYQDWTFEGTDYILSGEIPTSESVSSPVIDTKPEKRSLKVGDDVIAKGGPFNNVLGKIKEIREGRFGVEFCESRGAGHHLNHKCRIGYGWYYAEDELILTDDSIRRLKTERPPRRFNVGDRVTYKSLAQCGGDYRYGGSDQGGFVGTVEHESEYEADKRCYGLKVSTKEGDFCYNMLECEFHEYDGTTITQTLHVHKTTTDSFTLLADATVITPPFSGHVDPLSSYKQKPITIKQKPKTKLTII